VTRRFPPPWSIEEHSECFAVTDANGQRLAFMIWPRTTVMIASDDDVPRFPSVATWMPKPWHGLDLIVAAEQAMNDPPPAVR
jgi:hypothetical protein